MMAENKKIKYENPFYYNYVFTDEDATRKTISQWMYPRLFFRPMLMQVSNNHEFYFKIIGSEYFLLKIKKLT
jgi:hypothetical protein